MSPSENESTQINTLDSTTTDYSTSDIDSDEARKQSRGSLNQSFQSFGDTPIRTHRIPKHRRVSYANEKLQRSVSFLKRSFAAVLGVEESSLMIANEEFSKKANISEEMKTKASDLDRLTEQMRENWHWKV